MRSAGEAIAFPRSCVQFSDCLVAVGLSFTGQASPFPEVLPEQAVEVFVAAPLPRVVRVGEVAAHTGGFLDLPIAVELGAVVPGDRLERQAAVLDRADHRPVHGAHRAVR